MQTLHLRVEDDFIDTLLESLPDDKVTVVDQAFLDAQSLFEKALQGYETGDEAFGTYYKHMEKMDVWLKEREAR